MKKQINSKLTRLFLKAVSISSVFILAIPAMALADGPGFNGGVNDGGGGCAVPIDGGLSYLAVAGIGYGVKMYMSSKKHKAIKPE